VSEASERAPVLAFVTERARGPGETVAVAESCAAVLGSALLVQLRDHESEAEDEAVASLARELRRVTRAHGARFVVNGRLALAAATGADGIHLPSRGGDSRPLGERAAEARALLGRGALVSAPAHDEAELATAIAARVDLVLVSPVFASPGKGPARGLDALVRARALVGHGSARLRTRVFALGGVDESRVASCAASGADGVAVIRALYEAPDPARAAKMLARPWR